MKRITVRLFNNWKYKRNMPNTFRISHQTDIIGIHYFALGILGIYLFIHIHTLNY